MASIEAGDADRDGTMSTLGDVDGLEASLAATPPAIAPLKPPVVSYEPAWTRDAPVPAPAAEATTGTGPAPVAGDTCPNCGVGVQRPARATNGRVTAESFCPSCDFPLFWAAEAEQAKRKPDPMVRRRHPGVEGREALGSYRCRECGEPNVPDPSACCVRCGAALTPPPPPAPPPPPPDPVTIFVTKPYQRWKIAACVLAGTTVAAGGGLVWALVTR